MSTLGQCLVGFLFGAIIGILVQRSRFCNVAAIRDAMLFKTYRNTKALLIGMIVMTLGFTAFMTVGDGKPQRFDVGLNTLMGLFIFGVGMVLAGACTVSTWVKAGEGNVGAIWALLFTFIGMFLYSLFWSFTYWPPAPSTMDGAINLEGLQLGMSNAQTLQEALGVPAVVLGLAQAAILWTIYRRILAKERRASGTQPVSATEAAHQAAE